MTRLDGNQVSSFDVDTSTQADPHSAATPEGEERYWHDAYQRGLWNCKHYLYEDFSPAYRTGYLHRMRHENQSWPEAESELRCEWEEEKGMSRLNMDDVWPAIQAAWSHVSRTTATC